MNDVVIPGSSQCYSQLEIPDEYVNAASEIREILSEINGSVIFVGPGTGGMSDLQNFDESANLLLLTMMTPYSLQYSGIPLFNSLTRKVKKGSLNLHFTGEWANLSGFSSRILSCFIVSDSWWNVCNVHKNRDLH